MIGDLARSIRERRAILFVGAGVSRTLGLPSFNELVGEMATQLGYDPAVFASHGGPWELAEYYYLQKAKLGELRSWMDRTWHADVSKVPVSRVHNLIVHLDCPIVYTTNYDRLLEIAYREKGKSFSKVANVRDIANIKENTTQIVKFHGDFDEDDRSLVLTESSYFERLSFESPLDIKLRSDSVGREILFIGYSLNDINIRYLMYRLHRLWSESAFVGARPKSYVFLTRPNPVQQAILKERGIEPLVSKRDDPTAGLVSFLEELAQAAYGSVP